MRYEEERRAREKETDQLNKTIAALLTERDKPRLQPPKLPPLADGDDVDAVLTRFKQHMVTYDVPRHQWMLHLRPLLQGEALAAFLTLSVEEANQYSDVKKAILHRLRISQKTYQKRWWEATPKPILRPRCSLLGGRLGTSIWRDVKLLQIAMTLSPRNTCSGCSQAILHTG